MTSHISPIFATNPSSGSMLTIAHRGASAFAPENTIAAFDKAIDLNVDFIELDVQMTKDQHLVVIHDLTVNRTTNGTGAIKNLTLQEIKELDAGSWFSKTFQSEKIPTIDEVLERYRGKTGLLIDLKSPSIYPGIEKKLAEKLWHYKLQQEIRVQSFNLTSIKTFRSLLPSIQYGLVINHSISYYKLTKYANDIDFINIHERFISNMLIKFAHSKGINIYAWSVHDASTVRKLLFYKIDGITADSPKLISSIKDGKSRKPNLFLLSY